MTKELECHGKWLSGTFFDEVSCQVGLTESEVGPSIFKESILIQRVYNCDSYRNSRVWSQRCLVFHFVYVSPVFRFSTVQQEATLTRVKYVSSNEVSTPTLFSGFWSFYPLFVGFPQIMLFFTRFIYYVLILPSFSERFL